MPGLPTPRLSIGAKAAITVDLVAIAGLLFYAHAPGSNPGLVGLVLGAAAPAAFPALPRDRRSLTVIVLAACMALPLLERRTVTVTAFLILA